MWHSVLGRSEDNLEESVLFFDRVGFVDSRDGTQPVRLGSKCLSTDSSC